MFINKYFNDGYIIMEATSNNEKNKNVFAFKDDYNFSFYSFDDIHKARYRSGEYKFTDNEIVLKYNNNKVIKISYHLEEIDNKIFIKLENHPEKLINEVSLIIDEDKFFPKDFIITN